MCSVLQRDTFITNKHAEFHLKHTCGWIFFSVLEDVTVTYFPTCPVSLCQERACGEDGPVSGEAERQLQGKKQLVVFY